MEIYNKNMTKSTIFIIAAILVLIVGSNFAYWNANQFSNKIYSYIQQVDLSLYTHRGVVLAHPNTSPTIEEQIAKIDEKFAEGESLVALAKYTALLEQDPSNAELLLRIGIIYLQKNQNDLAQENLSLVYEDKESAFALDAAWFLALLHAQQNNIPQSKKLLQEVVDGRGNYFKEAGDLLGA